MIGVPEDECQTPSVESLPGHDERQGGGGEVEDGREGEAEADAVAVAHVGWAAEAEAAAQRAAEARESAAPETAGAVGPSSGARDVASPAPRVELAVASVLLADRAVLLAWARSLRVPLGALLGAGEPPAPRGRSARREDTRAGHAGARRAHREGAEPLDGPEGRGVCGPLPCAHPALAHAGGERARVRVDELPPSLSRRSCAARR